MTHVNILKVTVVDPYLWTFCVYTANIWDLCPVERGLLRSDMLQIQRHLAEAGNWHFDVIHLLLRGLQWEYFCLIQTADSASEL